MDLDARVEAWASLQLIPALSTRALFTLLKAFGGPVELRAASRESLTRFVPVDLAEAIRRGPDPAQLERTMKWLGAPDRWLIAWDDTHYPAALLTLPDPPAAFCYVGRRELLNRPTLAIVGSRNATPQGIEHAEAFAAALSDAGLTIISGLALGIDAAAHRGGLAGGGSTIAVLGTGIDLVYPTRNAELAAQIARDGLLVSEFPLRTPAIAHNFPRRHRLISGLARGCLVVEAALASGSLITARCAADQGRDVFAIPGSIHSPLSKGCHALIKSGAKLVESAEDVLAELAGFRPSGYASTAASTAANAAQTDSGLLAIMGHDPVDVDSLCVRAGLSAEQVASELLRLELDGRVTALPGGLYQRLEKAQRGQ